MCNHSVSLAFLLPCSEPRGQVQLNLAHKKSKLSVRKSWFFFFSFPMTKEMLKHDQSSDLFPCTCQPCMWLAPARESFQASRQWCNTGVWKGLRDGAEGICWREDRGYLGSGTQDRNLKEASLCYTSFSWISLF